MKNKHFRNKSPMLVLSICSIQTRRAVIKTDKKSTLITRLSSSKHSAPLKPKYYVNTIQRNAIQHKRQTAWYYLCYRFSQVSYTACSL